MKAIIIALTFATSLAATELHFEVVDTPGESSSKPQEYKWSVFLNAYDAFSAAIRAGVVRWRDITGDHEAPLPRARLVCDPDTSSLRVILADELATAEAQRLAAGLRHAVGQLHSAPPKGQDMKAAIERLQADVLALRDELLAERDLIRWRILNERLKAACSFPEFPGPPFPLRLKSIISGAEKKG